MREQTEYNISAGDAEVMGYNERALMVLLRESRRMEEGAERVRLVVEAMARKNGVRVAVDDCGEHESDATF